MHAVLGDLGEAAEDAQRERPVPRAPCVVDRLDPPEQLVGVRDARPGQRAACPRRGEEDPDDAGSRGAAGAPELGGEAEEHGLREDARLPGQDAERGGDGRGGGGAGAELAEARAGGVEGADARGCGADGSEVKEGIEERGKRRVGGRLSLPW